MISRIINYIVFLLYYSELLTKRWIQTGRLSMKYILLFALFIFLFTAGCGQKGTNEVVVYVSEEQVFSEPILRDFEAETGIRVKAVYDT